MYLRNMPKRPKIIVLEQYFGDGKLEDGTTFTWSYVAYRTPAAAAQMTVDTPSI